MSNDKSKCRGCDPAEGFCRECREAEHAARRSPASPAVQPPNDVLREIEKRLMTEDRETDGTEEAQWFEAGRFKGIMEFKAALSAAAPLPAAPFQQRVQPWMMACFGPAISADRAERNHRFLEEALELVQSTGCTAHEAHQLVDYVFGRPVGEPAQEVGGVMVTLAAMCLANDLDMRQCAEVELARIWTKVEQIRAKQAAKPKHSPLPAALTAQPTTPNDELPPIPSQDGDFAGSRLFTLYTMRQYARDTLALCQAGERLGEVEIAAAVESALTVYDGSCNHTREAIDYMATVLRCALAAKRVGKETQ